MYLLTTTHTVQIRNNGEKKVNTLNRHESTSNNHAQSRWLHMETYLSLQSVDFSSPLGNDIKSASICMIELPPKIWIPKQENKYIAPY